MINIRFPANSLGSRGHGELQNNPSFYLLKKLLCLTDFIVSELF